MSADSPRRSVRNVPAVIPPQVVSDRSLIDSVAGFINDVTLTSPPLGDPKEQILWIRFENLADISDPTCGEDWELEGNVPPPLVIILGFGSGIKVFVLPAHGEAVEVLSWRHGIVKALRILPTPISADDEMANEPIDQFVDQRPLMALCDSTSTGSSSQFCSISFVSLKNGAQVKMIKFKNPIVDILANRTSVVVTFQEKIAVFDARNLEDRLSITSCHPSPGMNPNPVALGSRWMAYSEWKLMPSKRSSGGCDCEGVSSYTATVLNAAKSLGKGLRELGEQVAAGLTGSANGSSASSSKSNSFDSNTTELRQSGLVTIIDIKHPIKEMSPTTGSPVTVTGTDPIIAHFIAHSDAIVALEFDPSGMLLLTADKRGHDFHVFRIQPHPAGSHLAAVHHLYILHRGDTSAKIQDISFSLDSRWVAVSSLRGTTHVFPITSYGGPAGVRTHGSLHVVNRLSRFHRSAGLTAEGRSSSPISHLENTYNQSCMPYNNPRTPPFPRPIVIHALAQIRQPFALGTPPGSAQNSYSRTGAGRQRLSSLSDDTGKEMRVCAVFAKARSWLLDPPNVARETPSHRMQRRSVDSLFIMAGHGALIQYDLDVKLASNVAKEKICDDTAIELEVEAKAQWCLGRRDNSSADIQPPLARDSWLLRDPSYSSTDTDTNAKDIDDQNDRWLSQVEIITHAGPHRRLWMGPQFVFKTYNTPSGAPLSHIDSEAVEIGVNSIATRPGRSSPMNMPLSASSKSAVPVLIESGSYSSLEQSPKLMDRFRHGHMESDFSFAHGDSRLREDLADAMRESPSVSQKDAGLTPVKITSQTTSQSALSTSIDTNSIDEQLLSATVTKSKSAAAAASSSSPSSSSRSSVLIEKVVNPLGTVTTITHSPSDSGLDSNADLADDDYIIHENCDEALFRPVVAIFCDDNKSGSESAMMDSAYVKPPEVVGSELVVPVIEKTRPKSTGSSCSDSVRQQSQKVAAPNTDKSSKLQTNNKMTKSDETASSTIRKDNKSAKKEKSPPLDMKSTTNSSGAVSKKSGKINKQEKTKKDRKQEEQTCLETTLQNTQSKRETGSCVSVATATEKKSSEYVVDGVRPPKREILPPPTKEKSPQCEVKLQLPMKTVTPIDKATNSKREANDNKPPSESADDFFDATASCKLPELPVQLFIHKNPPQELVTKAKPRKSEEKSATTCEVVENPPSVPQPPPPSEAKKPQDDGLKFYEKFCETISKATETIATKVSLKEADYPSLSASLADSKANRKHKGGSPKQSPQKATAAAAAVTIAPASRKDRENRDPSNDAEIGGDTITVTISPKRKNRNPVSDEKSKVQIVSQAKETAVEPKIGKVNEKSTKRSDLGSVSLLQGLNPELMESFLAPLSPLETFVPTFDDLHYKTPTDIESLINFESPVKDDEKSVGGGDTVIVERPNETLGGHKYTKDNLIFAMCGSLHQDDNIGSRNKVVVEASDDACIKSTSDTIEIMEELNDIGEQYLSLETITYQENTSSTSSSEETADCSRASSKKSRRSRHEKLIRRDDDEELRPLIGGTNLACSMTSSAGVGITTSRIIGGYGGTVGGGDDDDDDDVKSAMDESIIALEIAKAIGDSLPDNNHSDSSDQGGGNTMQVTEDLDFDTPPSPPNEAERLGRKAASGAIGSGSGSGSGGGSGSGNGSSHPTAYNGKKKSKRKKR